MKNLFIPRRMPGDYSLQKRVMTGEKIKIDNTEMFLILKYVRGG